MGNMPLILLVSWLAGLAAFVGGAVACIEGSADTETKPEVTHGIIAFGGGHRVARGADGAPGRQPARASCRRHWLSVPSRRRIVDRRHHDVRQRRVPVPHLSRYCPASQAEKALVASAWGSPRFLRRVARQEIDRVSECWLPAERRQASPHNARALCLSGTLAVSCQGDALHETPRDT